MASRNIKSIQQANRYNNKKSLLPLNTEINLQKKNTNCVADSRVIVFMLSKKSSRFYKTKQNKNKHILKDNSTVPSLADQNCVALENIYLTF